MKLDSYKKLLALGCFGRKQAEALWRENASKYLDDALKQGLIRRVRKDLYVSVSLETHQPTVNKFEIASRVSPTACVSHHAALEFYGYANQVFYDMTFVSQSKVKPFEFDGVSYRQIFSGISEGDPVVTSALIRNMSVPTAVLIGRVKSVSLHTAVVSTLLSGDCRLGVTLAKSRASGILEGTEDAGTGFALLRYLPVKTHMEEGDMAFTNSFSGNNPPGIPVGEIVPWADGAAGREHDHVYLEARVHPFVRPDAVRFVAVYIREKS